MSHNQAPARQVGQPSDQVTKVGRERRRPPRTSGHVATKALEVEAQSDTESRLNDTADTILSSRSRTSHPETHSQARRGLGLPPFPGHELRGQGWLASLGEFEL